MAVLAFTTGGEGDERAAAPPTATTAAPAALGGASPPASRCGRRRAAAPATRSRRRTPTVSIGPDLASSLKGMPASYIKESVVAPDAAAAAGYSTGSMPDDYAARIAPDDLDRLVSFLQANARR